MTKQFIPFEKGSIYKRGINSYYQLYEDAVFLQKLANEYKFDYEVADARLCRTAILLFILSLEAIINRAWDKFIPLRVHKYFLEREEKFNLKDKWELLPLLVECNDEHKFDKGGHLWKLLGELIQIRNDFVHPKHNSCSYLIATGAKSLMHIDEKKHFPNELKIKTRDIIYPDTRVSKCPSNINVEQVKRVRKIVDDLVLELNRLLNGEILKKNLHIEEKLQKIYSKK